ncbi:MAG: hypothetical protein WCH43_02260 [Verrucomicrobiota bacterium]
MNKIYSFLSIAALALFSALPLTVKAADDSTTIKGEILDLACYADHGAQGDKHMACAQKCIASGLPVGIKAEDGKVYLVVGQHKPLNQELATEAGKVVTLKGKVASRDGVNLLENAEIVK